MKTIDKRLLKRIENTTQDKHLKEILKSIDDSSSKFDIVEITHEPINLLQKIKSRSVQK